MCCGHRRQRRTPIVVTLGKMAYDKYQSNKAEKRARSLSDPNNMTINHADLADNANNEIVEKSGIDPPSYEQLVVNRSIVPPEPNVAINEKTGWVEVGNEEERDDLSDTESFYEVSDGMRRPNQDMQAASDSFVESWKSRRETKRADCKSTCAARKAEKAARKAAKKASV